MKKYSIEWLKKGQWRLSNAQKPKPFPGKYPTRIAWVAERQNERISYVGKPSRRATATMSQERRRATNFWAIEFDRNGQLGRFIKRQSIPHVTPFVFGRLRNSYHPFPEDCNSFFEQAGKWCEAVNPRTAKVHRVFWVSHYPVTQDTIEYMLQLVTA